MVPLTVPPTIVAQPQSHVAIAGSAVTLSCSATGTPAPAYQWRCNGTSLSGATAATLFFPSVTPAQAGTYSVTVTSIAGSILSSNALLSVYGSAAPTLCAPGCSGDGHFHLTLAGVPGCRYAILASTDLSNWTVLQTTNSPFSFTDTNTSGFPRRFYRAQYLQ